MKAGIKKTKNQSENTKKVPVQKLRLKSISRVSLFIFLFYTNLVVGQENESLSKNFDLMSKCVITGVSVWCKIAGRSDK